MISVDQPTVTIFKNILQTTHGDDFFLSDIMSAIRDGHWKEKIDRLRSLSGKPERSDFKKNELPYFTGSGTFEKRNDKSIRQHNGRLILDFDNLPDVNVAKSLICSDEFVEYCFVSASGNGLAAVIKIDGTKHAESFESAKIYFEQKYSFPVDPLRDVSRARFVSYDPNLYHNAAARTFVISKGAEQKIKDVIANMINRAVEGERHNTVLKASRLAGGFVAGGIISEDEIAMFILEKITAAGWRSDAHVATIKDGINNGKLSPLQLADAERMTVQTQQDVDAWREIYSFIHSVNRAGRAWTETDVIHLCEKHLISKEKITAAFNKVFTENEHEFDLDNKPEIVRVEMFIHERWQIVRNDVTGISEFRVHDAPEFERLNVNTIYRAIQHAGFKFSNEKLKSLLKSDFIVPFNPFDDYFGSLPTWTSEQDDHIQKMASFVKVKGSPADQKFFETQFKKHLVRCLHCTLSGRENRFVFVLVGEMQNTGKSTFIRFLNPFGLKYYTESPIRDNKDTELSFAENFIHNLEELSSLGKVEVNHLKSVISRAIIKERKPYGETADEYPRRANFFGSTNKDEFLTDTQNTRWLCFDIESIDWSYSKEIKIDNVWSQAFALYKSGFDCQLTKEESEQRDAINKNFEITDVEKDVVCRFFKQAPAENQYFKPTSEIMESIIKSTENRIRFNHWNLNKAMKQLEFIPDRKELNGHRVRGFYVWANPAASEGVKDVLNREDEKKKAATEQSSLPF